MVLSLEAAAPESDVEEAESGLCHLVYATNYLQAYTAGLFVKPGEPTIHVINSTDVVAPAAATPPKAATPPSSFTPPAAATPLEASQQQPDRSAKAVDNAAPVGCGWGDCHVRIEPCQAEGALLCSRFGTQRDAHVIAREAHLRAESLKAISRKEAELKKAGKMIQYASLSATKSYLHRLGFGIVRKGTSSFLDGYE